MDLASPFPDIGSLYLQELGAVLFGLVFLFLYRQSRVVYFGLWAVAWAFRVLSALFGYMLLRTGHTGWLAPYATFEFGFAIVLISAARAGFASGIDDWRTVLRLLAILPIFVALVFAAGLHSRLEGYYVSDALVLASVYLYNFKAVRRNRGIGARVFRFSLLLVAAALVQNAILLVAVHRSGAAEVWGRYLHQQAYWGFALHCLLAFAAMAMWSESQIDRLRELGAEVDHLRRATAQGSDLDHLTGLLNQAALARRVEQPDGFPGVVAVCDMDNFKDINDRYGHLVGDEILRNIGSLLRASIRHEDEAFRWGGDEFVILFHNQRLEIAGRRMGVIEARLQDFRVRGHGMLPISFSWGTADAHGRELREALDEADRRMYTLKRTRGAPAHERPPLGGGSAVQ
jgi:diguanylate cyclase (GGDEF)-like protein